LLRRSEEINGYLSRNLEARTSELEQANSALTSSEGRFRALVQNASDMVTIIDSTGVPIYASPSVERILGYLPEDWSELNVLSLIHPDDLARASNSLTSVVASPGAHPPTELRIRHADGGYRYLEMIGSNLLDDPAVHGIVHNTRDVTVRREMEAALRESEARFRGLAEHTPVGVYQLTPEGRVVYLNPAAVAMLEADELAAGQQVLFERFFTAESLSTTRDAHNRLARGAAFHHEVEAVGRHGSPKHLLLSCAPIVDAKGDIQSLVGTMMDITERRRAEDALRTNEEKFRLLFASNPHPMWVYDLDSLQFLEVNHAAEANYGYTRAEFLRMRITDIRPEEDTERLLAATLKRAAPLIQAGQWRHRTNDGRTIDVEITSHSIRFESRDAVLVVALDITERVRVTRELAESEERFRSLVQHASDLITVILADTTVIYQSPSVEGILGFEAPELIGRKLSEIMHPDDAGHLLAFLSQAATRPATAATLEARLRHHDGTWRTFEIVGSDHTADPAVGGFVLNTRDISERKALERQLRDQAFEDALTGLANRARFTDRLEHALERSARGANAVAVLFIDLDSFKSVNDSLGHAAGDSVLTQAGQRVQGCLRAGDTVARLGGDEFVALIEDTVTTEVAVHLAGRIVEELAKPFDLAGGHQVTIGASIGIAFANQQDLNRDLVRDADVAMYIAKTHGKGRYEVYNPGMHEAMARRLELVADLQRALETPELFLEYQPTFHLATGTLTGVEALVRWQHPRRGLIMPADFIALAEESGLILSLGRWVLTAACRQARQWEVRHGDHSLSMSVNVSVRQLQQATFVEEVAEVLGETGVDPSRIVLEVTESVVMQDVDATIPVLKRLKSLGVRLAIDDFGTGYSSLSYLTLYPFDILKIDKSFIDGIDAPGNQLELTRAIIELAKVLGLETVAEGIEREEQALRLRNLNCDVVQGFLFSRPLPAEAIAEMIDRAWHDLAA
jgi:diguanylate cyclase (GGDEF)-like protein/PAS domain S-box-containing protein